MNKLARANTKWTRAWDKRLARLISYIHRTCEFKQCCHVGNTAQKRRLGLFQDSDLLEIDLEDSKSTLNELLCIFGSHTFVSISWMCKKQTSVSLSSTEAQFFLDTGLRLNESQLLIFGIWLLKYVILVQTHPTTPKIKVGGNSSRDTTSNKHTQNQTKIPTQHNNLDLSSVDHVPSNANVSRFGAILKIF